jgi:hypothetical protein
MHGQTLLHLQATWSAECHALCTPVGRHAKACKLVWNILLFSPYIRRIAKCFLGYCSAPPPFYTDPSCFGISLGIMERARWLLNLTSSATVVLGDDMTSLWKRKMEAGRSELPPQYSRHCDSLARIFSTLPLLDQLAQMEPARLTSLAGRWAICSVTPPPPPWPTYGT